jgi:hypothetical protein
LRLVYLENLLSDIGNCALKNRKNKHATVIKES